MDQKRLLVAIAVSIAILLGFQLLLPKAPPRPAQQLAQTAEPAANPAAPRRLNPSFPGTEPEAVPPPRETPRLPISAARVSGSINLRGAQLDDLVLNDYHEEVPTTSPLVRVLEPAFDPEPNYVQFGWTSDTPGVKLPDETTLWTAPEGQKLTQTNPVTITWDNGAGLTFAMKFSVDANFMFTVDQSVHNATGAPVALRPYSRVRRDYEPVTAGYYILHEGPLGVLGGSLKDPSYATIKSEGEKHDGLAQTENGTGGWAGITDKYWLTALVPDQARGQVTNFRHDKAGANGVRYEVDFQAADALTAPAGGDVSTTLRAFAGAKEVHLLDAYESGEKIPLFSYAVDWGWFFFFTKPIFFALDWLYGVLGNFGLAILVFTVFAKLAFFPLANKSYKSMSKMKLLGPKMTALRERYKDEPAKLQSEIMQMYRAEKVNPASGCLPMVVQIPVFFSLYKVIFITIEMRHAPFYGWIHDLSALDPTNVFNLFGLIPYDPTHIAAFLHLSAWTLIMGFTMFMQQQLNPPPPDPMQARLFKFMPLIFMFMMGRFPAGLLIYWSWNNTLTIAQQWFIMRRTRLGTTTPALRRT